MSEDQKQRELEQLFLCLDKTDLKTAKKRRAAWEAIVETGLDKVLKVDLDSIPKAKVALGGCSLFRYIPRMRLKALPKAAYIQIFGQSNWVLHHNPFTLAWEGCPGGCPWCTLSDEAAWHDNGDLCAVDRCPEERTGSTTLCPTHLAQAIKNNKCRDCQLPLNKAGECMLRTLTPDEFDDPKMPRMDPSPLPADIADMFKAQPKKRAKKA